MNYEIFKDKLCNIDISKNCFKFLAERIASNNYRGIQCSQHNRYNMDDIFTLLDELYKIVGENKLLIRTTDTKKRPINLPEEANYARYVNNVYSKLKRCTQDSVRKNLFVDLHRMGLIERYKSNMTKLSPYQRGKTKYVCLSKFGLDFIDKSHTFIESKLRYTRAIDSLTKGLADELLSINELNNTITETEFQFFLSFYGKELNGHRYFSSELIEYIKEFRSLSRFQQQCAVDLVEKYCDPNMFKGDKTNKRDFHNWLNETQQIFNIMGQTAYYERDEKSLIIRTGENSLYENVEKLKRSQSIKKEYFKQHNIDKVKGFELHHIIPLCYAKNALEFSVLDNLNNLIYIDGYKHSIISQSGNRHTKLEFVGDDITFTDYNGDKIYCKKNKNVLYNIKNKDIMLSYNEKLLNSYEI